MADTDSPLVDLLWQPVFSSKDIEIVEAQGAGILYRVIRTKNNVRAYWITQYAPLNGDFMSFTIDQAKTYINTVHYPEWMQPFVKGI